MSLWLWILKRIFEIPKIKEMNIVINFDEVTRENSVEQNLHSSSAHLFTLRGSQKITLEHFKYLIKILPDSEHFFQNTLQNM